MMRVFPSLAVCSFLCVTPISAQTVTPVEPERVDEMIDVLAKNECRLTDAAAELMLPAAGFTDKTETRAIFARLLYHGRARHIDGALQLFDGPCPASTGKELRTIFFEAVAQNDCQLTALESVSFLNAVGIKDGEISAMIPLMINDGSISLSEDQKTIFVEAETCALHGNTDVSVDDAPLAKANPKLGIISHARTLDCTLHASKLSVIAKDLGLKRSEVKLAAQQMILSGEATLDEPSLTLTPLVCEAGADLSDDGLSRSDLIALFKTRDCAMSYETAKMAIKNAGFDWRRTEDALVEMVDLGNASVSGTDEVITLKLGECA